MGRTIFLCKYLADETVRHEVHEGRQVIEHWNKALESQRQEAARAQIFAAHLPPAEAAQALQLAFAAGLLTTGANPPGAKPDVAKPDVAKPDVAKPDVAKPEGA